MEMPTINASELRELEKLTRETTAHVKRLGEEADALMILFRCRCPLGLGAAQAFKALLDSYRDLGVELGRLGKGNMATFGRTIKPDQR